MAAIKAVLLELQNALSQNLPQSAVIRVFTVMVMAVVLRGNGLKRKQSILLGTVANAGLSSVTYLF